MIGLARLSWSRSKFWERIIACIVMGLAVSGAKADIYQCEEVDESDVISLSNVGQSPRCKKMVLQPKSKNPPSYSQINTQKETKSTYQSSRVDTAQARLERKRILKEEIELERRRLKDVVMNISKLEKSEESKDRQRSILSARQKEALHQSNIKLLEKELDRN